MQGAHSRVWKIVGFADRARRESFASETLSYAKNHCQSASGTGNFANYSKAVKGHYVPLRPFAIQDGFKGSIQNQFT